MSERQIGDKVFVTADNYGSPAVIIDTRESTESPPSHYKVRTDTGDEFWAFDFEVSDRMDSTFDTQDHIGKVQKRIQEIRANLAARAIKHDASKLEEPEKRGYDQLTTRLADVQYGTDEYRAALEEARDTIAHHYAANDHHPEHYENGIAGMSLPALVEMFCDWRAAADRTKQGSIMASLEHNRVRFGIDDQLYSILVNTVKEMDW